MGHDERGGLATSAAAEHAGGARARPAPTETRSPTATIATIEPLSARAGGRWGLAVRQPRGALGVEALLDAATAAFAAADGQASFVAFDVARGDLLRPSMAESLLHRVSMAGMSATSCLVLVPHQSVALPERHITDNLRRFRAAGAGLFLSGVSSRRHLPLPRQFPIDGIALAASVTTPGRDPRLLQTVVEATRGTGMATMAVADPGRRDPLAAAGVDHLQHAPPA